MQCRTIPCQHGGTRCVACPSARPLGASARGSHVCHADQHDQAWPTAVDSIGNTPLVQLRRLGKPMNNNVLLAKLEGSNLGGSLHDRPALSMLTQAEAAGQLQPGDCLIDASADSMTISLAMAAAMQGYKLKAVVPVQCSGELQAAVAAYGAQVITTPGGMEEVRELAAVMQARGEGLLLSPSANADNPLAHLRTTGPELWSQTHGRLTHLVAPINTSGAVMGASAYLKAMDPRIQVVGVQPAAGATIPGLRSWGPGHPEQQPPLYQAGRLDQLLQVSAQEAQLACRVLARTEGILAGPSAGATLAAALHVSSQVYDAVVVALLGEEGSRYLGSGMFSEGVAAADPAACGPRAFWSTVQCLTAGFPGPHFVLFLGQDEPQGGVHAGVWCPDCVGVAAAVRAVVVQAGGSLLEVHVGTKAAWSRAGEHPLRVDPRLQLRMLPCLMLWREDGPVRRAAGDLDALLSLVRSSNKGSSSGSSARSSDGRAGSSRTSSGLNAHGSLRGASPAPAQQNNIIPLSGAAVVAAKDAAAGAAGRHSTPAAQQAAPQP